MSKTPVFPSGQFVGDVYSITIAMREGFNLGLESSQRVLGYLKGISYQYVFSHESHQSGVRHLQAGIVTDSRQDNIRDRLINLLNLRRGPELAHTFKVKKFKPNDSHGWQVLVNYCTKEVDPFDSKLVTAEIFERPIPDDDVIEVMYYNSLLKMVPIDDDCKYCGEERCGHCCRSLLNYSKDIVSSAQSRTSLYNMVRLLSTSV